MSADLRCLTVRQPWAWAIVHGGKDVENRKRNIAGKYRGPVAIHAAAPKPDDRAYIEAAIASTHFDSTVLRERHTIPPYMPWLSDLYGAPLYMGAIVGVVDLVGVHDGSACDPDDPWAVCSTWAQLPNLDLPRVHHLALAYPRPLAQPLAARGRLGLWRPAEELAAAIWKQVAA